MFGLLESSSVLLALFFLQLLNLDGLFKVILEFTLKIVINGFVLGFLLYLSLRIQKIYF